MTDAAPFGSEGRMPARVLTVRGPQGGYELTVEIASILDSAVTTAQLDVDVLVAPRGAVRPALAWPERMRPAMDISRGTDDTIWLSVFLPRANRIPRSGPSALPDVSWVFAAPSEHDDPLQPPDPQDVERVADALGLTAESRLRLHALIRRPELPMAASELCAALGLAPDVAEVLEGTAAVGDLADAVTAERHGPWGTAREMLLARPRGSSLLSRLRRLDHDRPAASVAVIVACAALAAVAFWLAASDGHALSNGAWPAVFWACAAIISIETIGNAIMLAAIRRRAARTA